MFNLRTLDIWVKWPGQYCQASSAFACLCLVYCFWIAYADLDGFRIDAAKHMGPEALRTFCDVIREFTQSIGKERFLLAGEISGGREHAWEVVEKTGLDAALGIEDVPDKLEGMVTGYAEPADYFSVFRNWSLDSPNGHRWYRNQVVTLVDEHDQVRKGSNKYRFCGDIRFRDLAFKRNGGAVDHDGYPLHLLRIGAGLRKRRAPQRLGPCAPREHVRRSVWRSMHPGPTLFQRGWRPLPGLGCADRPSQEVVAAAARPTDAASGLGRRRHLQSSAPSWRPDAIARVLVAPIYRPGSPDRYEHRRGAAGHRLFDSCANISCRGRPVSSDLLVRPEECCATSIHLDCRMQRWAACRSNDTPARGLHNLPGGPWPCPPGLQAATGPETVATRFSLRVSVKEKCAR